MRFGRADFFPSSQGRSRRKPFVAVRPPGAEPSRIHTCEWIDVPGGKWHANGSGSSSVPAESSTTVVTTSGVGTSTPPNKGRPANPAPSTAIAVALGGPSATASDGVPAEHRSPTPRSRGALAPACSPWPRSNHFAGAHGRIDGQRQSQIREAAVDGHVHDVAVRQHDGRTARPRERPIEVRTAGRVHERAVERVRRLAQLEVAGTRPSLRSGREPRAARGQMEHCVEVPARRFVRDERDVDARSDHRPDDAARARQRARQRLEIERREIEHHLDGITRDG
jgi:hypothetical protein